MEMASADIKSFVQKLAVQIVPISQVDLYEVGRCKYMAKRYL